MKTLIILLLLLFSFASAEAQVTSINLSWTATGNDGMVGTATSILVFYSSTTPDSTGLTPWLDKDGLASDRPVGITNWINQAKNKIGPTPLIAGSIQNFAVQDTFPANVKQWFMVRTCDATGNCSYSNFTNYIPSLVDIIAPKPVRDLKVK